MDITDVPYMDELLCGIESKLGASVPPCLLTPIVTASTSLSSASSSPSGSTPFGSVERLPQSPVCSSTPEVNARHGTIGRGPALGVPLTDDDVKKQQLSPVEQLAVKHKQLDEKCHTLKSGMDALRALDKSVMKQLFTIYDAIEELRWMMESYEINDSCESINSSVYESREQIHEKWMTERRQWQSQSSRDLSNWRDESRSNLGRLNSAGSRMQAIGESKPVYGLSLESTNWRSPQKEMNRSFPQFTSGRNSDFERQRRSSVDHIPTPIEPSEASPSPTRKRRSSSGALDAGLADDELNEQDEQEPAQKEVTNHKKQKFMLHHSKSSPAFESNLEWVEVTDTTLI